MGRENLMPIVMGRKGWDGKYDEIFEFKEHVSEEEPAGLAHEKLGLGWVLYGREHMQNTTQPQHKIRTMLRYLTKRVTRWDWIVQFWEPKMVEDRLCLVTSNQPYAVSSLAKGLASVRKKCMTRYYFVDDEANQDELGPPGRVFRNQHPEICPDFLHYTRQEFSIKNDVEHYLRQRGYFALPIFDDKHNCKCVGVLEFIGFQYDQLPGIEEALEVAKLRSTHIDFHQRFLRDELPADIIICRKQALIEILNALRLMCSNFPQLLDVANVWVPYEKCYATNSNISCMEMALSSTYPWEFMPTYQVCRTHVQTRKGMIGMVLASENKSCFCQNLSEFSIVDQPLSHFEIKDTGDVCFAICLQSSLTGDLIYVLEFFLHQGPPTYDYVRSFLNFLLPTMKQELKSFKMACGKQLGEELVVEVIEFSEANKLIGLFEPEHAGLFPIKFKSVQYSPMELKRKSSMSFARIDTKSGDEYLHPTVASVIRSIETFISLIGVVDLVFVFLVMRVLEKYSQFTFFLKTVKCLICVMFDIFW